MFGFFLGERWLDVMWLDVKRGGRPNKEHTTKWICRNGEESAIGQFIAE